MKLKDIIKILKKTPLLTPVQLFVDVDDKSTIQWFMRGKNDPKFPHSCYYTSENKDDLLYGYKQIQKEKIQKSE